MPSQISGGNESTKRGVANKRRRCVSQMTGVSRYYVVPGADRRSLRDSTAPLGVRSVESGHRTRLFSNDYSRHYYARHQYDFSLHVQRPYDRADDLGRVVHHRQRFRQPVAFSIGSLSGSTQHNGPMLVRYPCRRHFMADLPSVATKARQWNVTLTTASGQFGQRR